MRCCLRWKCARMCEPLCFNWHSLDSRSIPWATTERTGDTQLPWSVCSPQTWAATPLTETLSRAHLKHISYHLSSCWREVSRWGSVPSNVIMRGYKNHIGGTNQTVELLQVNWKSGEALNASRRKEKTHLPSVGYFGAAMQPVKSKSSLNQTVLTPLFVLFLRADSLSCAALTPLLIPSLNLLSSSEPFCHHPASCVQFEPTLDQSRCLRVCARLTQTTASE